MLLLISEFLVITFIIVTGLISAVYIMNIIIGNSPAKWWPFLLFIGIILTSFYIGEIKDKDSGNFIIESEVEMLTHNSTAFEAGHEAGYEEGYADGVEHTIKSATVTRITERGCYIEYNNSEEHYYTW